MPPESHFADADGIRLHYLTWRPPDAASGAGTVVLAHATGFLAALWTPIAERLAAIGYTIFAYDARGHGDSEKPPPEGNNYAWDRFWQDLRALLDALDLRDVLFAGHSAGGAAGLHLASQHPAYVSRIAVFEPIMIPGSVPPDQRRHDEMSEGARRRRQVFASTDEAYGQYRTRSLFERWPEEMLRLYAEAGTYVREDGQVQLKCPPAVEATIFAHSGDLDTWERLADISAPTLVMLGGQTEGFLKMVAEGAAERLPQGRLHTFPDLGHLGPMEDPEAVAAALIDFFAG